MGNLELEKHLEDLMQLDALEVDEVMTSVYGLRRIKEEEDEEGLAQGQILTDANKTLIAETYAKKVRLRRELLNQVPEHDWILELYAGRGAITENVYAGHCQKLWLVDANSENLEVARGRLKTYPFESFCMDNLKWMNTFLRIKVEEFQEHLTLVDFDAFGMPGQQIQMFFEIFKVQRPLCVALTDGGSRKLGFSSEEVAKVLSKFYMMDKKFKRGDTVFFANQLMDNVAREQGCKCIRVNDGENPQKTVIYATYLLVPEA